MTKTTTVYEVERTDWFGECETVKSNMTRDEAEAFARQLRRTSKAVDDPDDKIRYHVVSFEWTREV